MSAASRIPIHVWITPGALVVAERPGGGGRSHRPARREAELAWWHAEGVRTIVSAMRSRHGLVEYAQRGFGVRWHPLKDLVQARAELPRLADEVAAVLAREPGAVLVHCDRPGEWLAGIDAALRLKAGHARDGEDALAQAQADGLPVGDLARALLGADAGPPAAA